MSVVSVWLCPEHGIVDESFVRINGDENSGHCLHEGHAEPQEIRHAEVVPVSELEEARSATAEAVRKAKDWQDQFVKTRIDLADAKAVIETNDQSITTEAAANLVREARRTQQAAELERDSWKTRVDEWRTRHDALRAEFEASQGNRDDGTTTEAATNLVREARSAQEAAEVERDRLLSEVALWKHRHGEAQAEAIEARRNPVEEDDGTAAEAAANLVREARSAQEAAEGQLNALRNEVTTWKRRHGEVQAEAIELRRHPVEDDGTATEAATNLIREARSAQEAAERQLDVSRNEVALWKRRHGEAQAEAIEARRPVEGDDGTLTEAAANLVREARSATLAAERDRDALKAQCDTLRNRAAEAHRFAEDAERRLREVDSDITTEAAANLVAEARSSQATAERALDTLKAERDEWHQRYSQARDGAIEAERRFHVDRSEAVQTATELAQEAAANLVREARSAQDAAERELETATTSRDGWKATVSEWRDRHAAVLTELEEARRTNDDGVTKEAAANLVAEARAAQQAAERERDSQKAESEKWKHRYGGARTEVIAVERRLGQLLANGDDGVTAEAAANLVSEARSAQEAAERQRDTLKRERDGWKTAADDLRNQYAALEAELDEQRSHDNGITAEAAANLVREARVAQESAERERDELRVQRDEWKRHYGQARTEVIAAERQVHNGDDGTAAEAAANLLREARAKIVKAEHDRDDWKAQCEKWKKNYGEARNEAVSERRRLHSDDDTAAQLRAKRDQLAALDNVARDAQRFLASLGGLDNGLDTDRRSLLRRLRETTS